MKDKFSVIICTYMRPKIIGHLIESITRQAVLPSEVIIVDGSTDFSTKELFEDKVFSFPFNYMLVDEVNRGLTRQRNVGISQAKEDSQYIIFLDDDVVLEPSFFQELLKAFEDPGVIGVDGWISNENLWKRVKDVEQLPQNTMVLDGFYLPLSSRDRMRAALGLFPFRYLPGSIPPYGHGKSSLPPSGKIYAVEHIMGGITAYRKSIFQHIQFSHFFEGYGLYEDFDFSVRASRYGKLVTNTAARLAHYHAPGGRPNLYKYGRMVVRNGWYVWRLKYPHPGAINILKWHLITCLLMFIRLVNAITGPNRRDAFDDFRGRFTSWLNLLFKKPLIEQ